MLYIVKKQRSRGTSLANLQPGLSSAPAVAGLGASAADT
jgi:hypothetical protein